MHYYIKVITTLIVIIPLLASASQLNLGKRIIINSSILDEKREIQILLPENYQANSKATYPVVYLLDGDYNFHGISGMLDLLANKGQLIPEVILVGIADKGTEKYRQYMTPEDSVSPDKNKKGSAGLFLKFLNNEVKPFIKKEYRSSEHSTLVGLSMGGLFVLNTVLVNPNSFKNYVAISPSVWVSDAAIVNKAKNRLGKTEYQNISLYLSLADEMRMGQYGFIHQLDVKPLKGLDWRFKHYPDENHNSVGLVALRDSLKSIFNGWYVQEKVLEKMPLNEILQYFENVQKKLDLQQSLPASAVHIMIRLHYRQKKDNEISVFIQNAIKKFPASKQILITKQAAFAGHYDSPQKALSILKEVESEFSQSIEYLKAIGATYEQLKNRKAVRKYYQKAFELAKAQKANQWQLNIIKAKLK